jgi:hypothetical protein
MEYRSSMHPKRHQRLLNKYMRRVNKTIEQDPLWRGRFIVRQKDRWFGQYEDKSGYVMWHTLVFRDKKTGRVYQWTADTFNWIFYNGTKLFQKMNSFIVDVCKAWENENPYEDKTDYRAVP